MMNLIWLPFSNMILKSQILFIAMMQRGCYDVWIHRHSYCLFNSLFSLATKKTKHLRYLSLWVCGENPLLDFPYNEPVTRKTFSCHDCRVICRVFQEASSQAALLSRGFSIRFKAMVISVLPVQVICKTSSILPDEIRSTERHIDCSFKDLTP